MPQQRRKAREPSYAGPKPTLQDILDTRSESNQVSIDFLKIDLQTALTFSALALQSPEGEKKSRNQHNARRGYDTILRLIEKVYLSDSDAKSLGGQLLRLKSELEQLGEIF
jgi:hypothetical protein